jgi:hypothetical protein
LVSVSIPNAVKIQNRAFYNGKKIKQKYTCQGFYDDSMKKTVETYYDSKGNKISKKTVKNQKEK